VSNDQTRGKPRRSTTHPHNVPQTQKVTLACLLRKGKFGTCLRDFVQMAGLHDNRILPVRQNASQANRVMRKYRDVLVDCPHPKSDG